MTDAPTPTEVPTGPAAEIGQPMPDADGGNPTAGSSFLPGTRRTEHDAFDPVRAAVPLPTPPS